MLCALAAATCSQDEADRDLARPKGTTPNSEESRCSTSTEMSSLSRSGGQSLEENLIGLLPF